MSKDPKYNKKLVYLGTDSLGEEVFKYLFKNFNLKLTITAPSKKQGRGRKNKKDSPIKKLAVKLKTPTLTPQKLDKRVLNKINSLKPDFILTFAYGKLIPIKKIGCKDILNIHPSLLPKLRGPSPIRWAILKGLDKTGVTLMKMDEKIDHGPIIAQKKIGIEEREDYPSLREKIKKTSLELVQEKLSPYLEGKVSPQPQDHNQATFSKLISKKDGRIDWNKPADEIDRKIRALNPKPGTYTEIDDKILKIHSAKPVNNKLKLGEVQLEGRKKMDFEDFRNGWKKELDFSHKIA